MRPIPARVVATLFSLMLLAMHVSAPVLGQPQRLQQGVSIEMAGLRKVNTQETNPFDGSLLSGGFLSPGEAGCTAGVQGFFLQEDANQTPICQRYGNASSGCSGTGSGGPSLFGNLGNVYQEFVETSNVTATAVNPANGDIYLSVNVQVAWRTVPANELEAAYAAIVLRLDAGCNVVEGLYLGPVPDGVPDTSAMTCDVLCAALAVKHPQYAIEALAFNAGALGLAGWYRAPAPDPTQLATKDLLIGQPTLDLSAYVWGATPSFPGNDVGLDLVIAANGDFFATGYYGQTRDIFVVAYSPQGSLRSLAVAGGPLDDQGSAITINSVGEVEVEGYFTDYATFGGQTQVGAGPTAFKATYSYGLDLLSVEVPDPNGNNGTTRAEPTSAQSLLVSTFTTTDAARNAAPKAFPTQPVGSVANDPYEVQLVEGTVGSSSEEANWVTQVKSADNVHLHLYGEPVEDPDSDEAISITRYLFQIGPLANEVRTFKLEVASDFCSVLTIDLSRAGSDNVYTLPLIEICPLDEPVITVEVSQSISNALGFAATAGGVLEATLHMSLNGSTPCSSAAGIACVSTNGKDSCVDEVEVGTDY